jgi:tRNA (guanine37-N1)-methyltransferase
LKKQIAIITPVPEMVDSVVQQSMLRRAVEQEKVELHCINLRDYGKSNYRQIDDTPFGGGVGMVMMPKPLFQAIDKAIELVGGSDNLRVIYPSPQGELWNHKLAVENSEVDKLIVICGHYKGVDERVIEKYVTHEYSIGDFVVTGGELPALIVIDSIVRLIPGVLNKMESALSDTFAADLLDAPYYTQPREIEGMKVPDVLISGHHEKIKAWRKNSRKNATRKKRPDIWKKYLELNESEENDE